ncbi:hypothetical protein DPMN_194319 [Dreissena polymorpha]|uniref:Uncharacterized protein n=1 Tax=Dreissena polymorpha TaxID=45954 RepID=A0A9D4BEU5_DREPO|nr:hypothetical protein DPMN_194319 [Dreissena polymorpha]
MKPAIKKPTPVGELVQKGWIDNKVSLDAKGSFCPIQPCKSAQAMIGSFCPINPCKSEQAIIGRQFLPHQPLQICAGYDRKAVSAPSTLINILTKFHKDWMKTVTSIVYTRTKIMQNTETFIHKNILTKFHKDWMKTVTSTINILTKFHKDWMKTVTSTVYTSYRPACTVCQTRKLPMFG